MTHRLASLFAMPPTTAREPALDGIRGLAVSLTFGVHFAGSYLAKYRGGNPDIIPMSDWREPFDKLLYWTYHSHHGVQLFFTLSGFLIARLILNGTRFSYVAFLRKRIERIYPPFLFSLSICILMPMVAFGRGFPSMLQLAGNLLFLNAIPKTGIVGIVFYNVTWSLFFELVFYLTFPGMVYVIRKFGMSLPFGLVFGGLALAFLPFIFGIYQTEVFVLFFAGVLVGLMSQEQGRLVSSQVPDSCLAAFYLCATTMAAFGIIDSSRFIWIFAFAAALLVMKGACGDGWLTRILSRRPLVWLGEISFSFYLTHSIALAVVFVAAPAVLPDFLSRQNPPLHALILALAGFIGSIALAAASFALFERPYFREKRRHLTIKGAAS